MWFDIDELTGLCRPANYAERRWSAGSLSRQAPNCDIWLSAFFETSERVQELEQPVIGLESFCPLAVMRFELGKRGLLELEMSMEIGLGRLDRLMAEPRRDH